MNKIKLICSLLLTACLAIPAAAQANKSLTAAVSRQALQAQQKHHAVRCAACGEEITHEYQHCSATDYTGLCVPGAPQKNNTTPVCAACGEEMPDRYQHCAATDYTGLCSASAQSVQEDGPADNIPSVCPLCGNHYTIDEKYHGQTHQCPVSENGNETQEVTFDDPSILYCAEELWQADRDAHNGYPVHTLEYYYRQLLAQRQADTQTQKDKAKDAVQHHAEEPHATQQAD